MKTRIIRTKLRKKGKKRHKKNLKATIGIEKKRKINSNITIFVFI